MPLAFLAVIVLGAAVLMLPVSRSDPSASPWVPSMFTSVAAVCVTGLSTVDASTFWTPFGQAVILALIQVGGFGIMTLATLLSLLVAGRLGLRSMLVVQSESHTLNLGDVRAVLRRVAITMVSFEVVIAVVLTIRFMVGYHRGLGSAVWHGVFHAVSAFNSAGFSLYSDSLTRFVVDPWICFPLCVAVIGGGIGFPVLVELYRRYRRPSLWSVHMRLTVYGTLILLGVGIGGVLLFEWSNPDTLGHLGVGGKLVAGVTGGVMPRTAGFASIDYGLVTSPTRFLTDILMFIGGGSAGTAGGIKVGTFFLLAFVIWGEIRGEPDVKVGHRSIPYLSQRLALVVALLGIGAVTVGTFLILQLSHLPLDEVLLETVAAFSTAGLSTGITASLPTSAQVVLMILMYVGRVGTVTVATALALNRRHRLYRLPEERPIIG
ncbi:MAG: TrkH family potassium uptake protein [Nocardioidaceae bacterium]